MNEQQWETLEKAVETYGNMNQIVKFMQEMSELQVELTRSFEENRFSFEKLVEEMADVSIMMSQMCIVFEILPEDMEGAIERKIKRLEDRLNERENRKEDQERD